MTYRVEIKEISKGYVEVEAESREEAVQKVEQDYWKQPLDYLLEPEDTFFA